MANNNNSIRGVPGHNGSYQINGEGKTIGIFRVDPEGSETPYRLRQVDGTTTQIIESIVQQLKKCRSPRDYMPLLYLHLSKESRRCVDGRYAEYAQLKNSHK